MKVYIAGPYTEPDPAVNTARAMDVWHEIADMGLTPFIPHLCHFLHIRRERPYTDWMEWDLAWLEDCDALYRIDGRSSGADTEVERATALGIPVFRSTAALQNWALGCQDGRDRNRSDATTLRRAADLYMARCQGHEPGVACPRLPVADALREQADRLEGTPR